MSDLQEPTNYMKIWYHDYSTKDECIILAKEIRHCDVTVSADHYDDEDDIEILKFLENYDFVSVKNVYGTIMIIPTESIHCVEIVSVSNKSE